MDIERPMKLPPGFSFYNSQGQFLFPVLPGKRYHMGYLRTTINWGFFVANCRLRDRTYLARRVKRELKKFQRYIREMK